MTPQQYLSAGWIDDHVHCFEEMTLYYDYPDQIGVNKGVTTVIDAGRLGQKTLLIFMNMLNRQKQMSMRF